MDEKAELERLRERALTLEDTIADIDNQIERAMHAVAAGTFDTGHALGVLQSRRNDQAGLFFDLGKVTAQIEDLEHRIQEQDEHDKEHRAARDWQDAVPVGEDHLDWLRPTLDAPAQHEELAPDERHPHYEGEERLLSEMHRDQEPEDYLDWWKR